MTLDDQVTVTWASEFGIELFNLYTLSTGRPKLLFSQRQLVVKAMLKTMLFTESELLRELRKREADAR